MNPDSVKTVVDTANFIEKHLPEIVTQLNILKPLIMGLVILLAADFITGTRKAKALKQQINSGGFRRSVSKFNDYSIAIVSSQVFTWMFTLDITLAYYVALFICGIELKSIWENVSQTTGVNIIGYFKGFIPDPKQMFKKEKADSEESAK
jgi:phage-related holin